LNKTPIVIIDKPGRFSRVCGEQVADSHYANPIEGPTPSPFSSPWFDAACFVGAIVALCWMVWVGMSMPVPW
jgi:nicotinamide riboside transporter PnuC